MNYDAIPQELRERPSWVVWRLEERDGKKTKVPYRPDGAGRASSTDPSTWGAFEGAVAAVEALKAEGVGFVFADTDPYTGIDLDTFDADAGAIVSALDSYSERSVSGRGAHVIVKAHLNGRSRRRNGPLEVYDSGRFFVMTGDLIRGCPGTVEERQDQLEEVLDYFLPERPEQEIVVPPVPVDLADEELLHRALIARNGAKFAKLWNGDTGDYPSHSEADAGLCMMLAFWTGRDPDRIDRLFRASGLMRPKWDRQDYREATIAGALERVQETYSPDGLGAKSPSSPSPPNAVSPVETERNGLRTPPYRESGAPESVPPRVFLNTGTDSEPESVADFSSPFSLPIRDFIEREREQREPLLADADGRAVVGHRSLILAGALGGHGKTTFFIDLALHLAAGVDYPPFTVPKAVSILMIENEGPEDLFAEKLKARLGHFPHELRARLDVHVMDWGGFNIADQGARERLAWEIADKGYDLVFGDPLDSLGIAGVGSPEDTRDFLALMKDTGLNKTVAWWLNTHPRKEETKEALNEIAGAWGGKPDTVFLLRMLDDDRTQIRQAKLRWAKRGKGPTLLMAFDPDTEAFTFLGEESDVERDYVEEIAELLADGRWRIMKEIAAPKKDDVPKKDWGIGANVDTVKKVLEEHPDVFESRTGDEAKALGRSPQAVLWGLRSEGEGES